MSDTRLPFDEADEGIRPAADRLNPILWIRRLVIVERLAPDAQPIREVEFRRGLNIVATARPDELVDGPVGHNVGKTLLTRLLRYCLGEQHFAREAVRPAISAAYPEGFVICEVLVDGSCWVVARPIGDTRSSESKCLQVNDWRSILEEQNGAERFAKLVETIEKATIARFSATLLPHVNRPVRWLDLLAWLSRDQYCRYRHPLEWRVAWTESGTADLHNEDASILIRLVMDLLDDEEAKLIHRHKQLLTDKNAKDAEVAKLEQRLSQTRRFLEERLHIGSEMLTDDLFGEAARGQAEGTRTALQKQLADLDKDSEWSSLLEELEVAKQAVARKEQEIATRTADRQTKEGELKQHEAASSDDLAASLANLGVPCPLPADSCPMKNPARQPGTIEPFRQVRIQEATQELQSLDQLLAGLEEENKSLIRQRERLQTEVDQQQATRRQQERRIRGELSVLDAVVQEAKDFVDSQRTLRTATGVLARLERDLSQSRESHHSARSQLVQRNAILNHHFNLALRSLVAVDIAGSVRMDMRGLHLSFGDKEPALGEAMATSETVLSLDIACLSAAICGLGYSPRFAIHDSPREADLEPHIYARLFVYLKSLEDAFGGSEPSFQYIVTTTTPPPPDMEKPPYLRLVLDARSDEGLLLRRRF
ncbi:MAG: hypothetical protein KF688_01115 [Pirellulales bacterium]|nr:hypothetical protein [Pirellulales bacterium]